MKKSVVIAIIIAIVCVFLAGCVFDSISYCPYCSSMSIEKKADETYKCNNCSKEFGAKKL